MWKLCGIDFEAQGKDPLTTMPTEVGAILVQYSEEGGVPKLEEIARTGSLLYAEDCGYEPQTAHVEEITGITDAELKQFGLHPKGFIPAHVFPLMEKADYILAHNKRYDERLFKSFCERSGLTPPGKPWICTYQDIPYAEKYRCKQLSHLALDHKIKMDHRELHRATGDVELMLELVSLYKFSNILKYANTPWVFVRVEVPPPWTDKGVGSDLAKASGYGWQRAKGTEEPFFEKMWVKRIKLDKLEEELKSMPTQYRVSQIQPVV